MSFPRYPKYKDSGVEWLGEVPEHWKVKRLCFAADMNPSKSEISASDREMPVSFLPMEAIGDDGSLDLERQKTVGDVENGYTYFRDGDVTVAKITPCFENGKGALMRGLLNGVGFGTTELIVARPRVGEITSQYLHAIFRSTEFRCLGEAQMYGAGGQKRVPESFVRNFATAIPPLPEQVVIAAFLDRETAKIDALASEQRRLIELLKEKRQAVISHAVTKGLNPHAPMKPSGIEWLGEIPSDWRVMPLKRLVQPTRRITYGIVQPGQPDPTGRYMIRGKDYSDGWCSPEDIFRVSDQIEIPYTRSRMRKNDLVMTIVGAGVGNVAVIPDWLDGANITQTTARIAVDESQLNSEYACNALQGVVGQRNLERYVYGSAQPRLNIEHVDSYLMTVPPLDEQRGIVQVLKERSAGFDELTAEAERAIDLLQERRTALISAAVTGKIDVRGLAEAEAA